MSHTPGPWREYNADGSRTFKNWRVAAENRLVATVADVDDSDRFNALLIAAAPELLAACKYALSQLEAAGIVCGDVRAAIAKATGH